MMLIWATIATFMLIGALICALHEDSVIATLLMCVAWPVFLVILAYVAAERHFLFGVRYDRKAAQPSEFMLRSPIITRTYGPLFFQSYDWWRNLGSRWTGGGDRRQLELHRLIRRTRKVGLGNPSGRHVEVYKTRDVDKVWEMA